jgi:hypothetical protein
MRADPEYWMPVGDIYTGRAGCGTKWCALWQTAAKMNRARKSYIKRQLLLDAIIEDPLGRHSLHTPGISHRADKALDQLRAADRARMAAEQHPAAQQQRVTPPSPPQQQPHLMNPAMAAAVAFRGAEEQQQASDKARENMLRRMRSLLSA